MPVTSSVLKQTYQKQHVQTKPTAGGLDNDVNMAEHKEDREILSTASTRKGKKLVPLISAPLEIKHSSEIKKELTKGDSQSMTRHHKMKDSYLNCVLTKVTTSTYPYTSSTNKPKLFKEEIIEPVLPKNDLLTTNKHQLYSNMSLNKTPSSSN